MPFGSDCEFKDFAACVAHYKGKVEDPDAYCAVIQDKTEGHCHKATLILDERRSLRRRGRWQFDPETNRYFDPDGTPVSESEIDVALLKFLEAQRQKAENLTGDLGAGTMTLPEWENEMRWVIKDAFGASYVLGRGGRPSMTPADWGRVGRRVRDQYGFLANFASQMAAGSVTTQRAVMRASMYPLSARQAHQRGQAAVLGDPNLPAYPGDGSTACHSNCGCSWLIQKVTLLDGAPAFHCTWQRAKSDSCTDCLWREQQWAPLVVPG
jgi:hypothetical protein